MFTNESQFKTNQTNKKSIDFMSQRSIKALRFFYVIINHAQFLNVANPRIWLNPLHVALNGT